MKKFIKKAYNYKIYSRVDFYHRLFSLIFGKKRLINVLHLKYNFYLKYNLFLQKSKPFWLGKCLNHIFLKPIWIDPQQIKYQIKDGDVPYVQDGDWDLKKKLFEINDAIDELYVQKPPLKFENTTQFKLMNNQINQGLKPRGCSNEAEVFRYFEQMNILFNKLKAGNYLLQGQLNEKKNRFVESRYPNEIIVSIDRNGNYLHERGGSHRLSMAKILKIKKVPVVVIRKHLKIFLKEKKHDNFI